METPDNQPLIDAIESLQDAFGEGLESRMRALLQAILGSTLITGDEEGEPTLVEDDEGNVLLALFATTLDLHFFSAGTPSAEVRGSDVIRRVAAGDYDGLVINPGTRQFELRREDVLDYFEVDDP